MILRHKPYDRTTYDGNTVNWRTRAMLLVAEDRLGFRLNVTQGSYSTGVQASAGTHDGGGAVDIVTGDIHKVLRVLKNIDFAAWHRSVGWDGRGGIEHIHAVAIGDRDLAPLAAQQVQAYLNGRDGLAGNGVDNSYRPEETRPFDYATWQKRRVLKIRIKRLTRKREHLDRDLREVKRLLRNTH